MAIEAFAGGEEGVLNDGVSGAGTSSISSAQARSGTYSYRTNPTTTATGSISILAPDATGALATLTAQNLRTTTFSMYIATLPAANEEVMFRAGAGATRKLEVRITSGGILKLYDKTPTLVATGTTALTTGTWYRIGITSQNNGGGLGSYGVTIDGTTEYSGTCDQGVNNPTRIQLGKVTNTNGQSVDFYFDDIIVDNASTVHTNVWSKFSQPTANGSVMQWTSGTGGSDYTQIDETPRSTTDYIMSTGAANDVARFPITSMSGQGISGATIVGLYTGIWVRENAAATTATKTRMVSGATTTDGTAFDPGTGGNPYYDLYLTDPNTGSAWTETNLNAIEWGAIETNAVSTRMVWAGAYILYTPAVASTKRLAALGVG